MTDPALWSALPGILTGLAALGSACASFVVIIKTNKKVEEIHKATNSMKDELVKVTGEAEHAKGKLEGQMESREG